MVCTISEIAYCKIILHGVKYPSSPVSGVLIGTLTGGNNLHIADSIPLFHTQVLAPLMEAALMQIEAHCKEHGLQIVGNYFGNERLDDVRLSGSAASIGDRIRENSGRASILMIDNQQLSQWDKVAVKAFDYDSKTKKWTQGEAINFSNSNTPGLLASYMERDKSWSLIDFESHLDNPTLDWLNTKLFV